MKKKDKRVQLANRIELLKAKQETDFIILKNQFEITYESLKPINLIKETFNEIKHNSEIKTNIFKTSLGILGGYISKKVLFGNSNNPFKKISGNVLQYIITNLITNKVENK